MASAKLASTSSKLTCDRNSYRYCCRFMNVLLEGECRARTCTYSVQARMRELFPKRSGIASAVFKRLTLRSAPTAQGALRHRLLAGDSAERLLHQPPHPHPVLWRGGLDHRFHVEPADRLLLVAHRFTAESPV